MGSSIGITTTQLERIVFLYLISRNSRTGQIVHLKDVSREYIEKHLKKSQDIFKKVGENFVEPLTEPNMLLYVGCSTIFSGSLPNRFPPMSSSPVNKL